MKTPPSSFGVSHKHDRYDFITNCVAISSNIKFQYWFNNNPCKTWYSFNEMLQKHPNMFYVNNQILRQKIYSESVIELVLDLDDKDFNKNIENAFDIYEILKSNNIKPFVYYSGGKGFHIHALINNERKINNDQVKPFLTFLMNHFKIEKHWFDASALSPNVMITCEGYQKRKSDTQFNKIYIDFEKNFNEDMVLQFIDENKFNNLVNIKLFENVSHLNDPIWVWYDQYVSKQKSLQIRAPKDVPTRVSRVVKNNSRIRQYLKTFCDIYKEKQIISTHHYPSMIVLYLRSEGLSDKYIKKYFKMFLKINNIALKTNVDTFIKGVGKCSHVFMFRFRTKDNHAVHECFTMDEFATLNNKNYWIVNAGEIK